MSYAFCRKVFAASNAANAQEGAQTFAKAYLDNRKELAQDKVKTNVAHLRDNIDEVRTVLIHALDLQQPPESLTPDTALFGALPELDSLGVVALVGALEDQFEITIEDDEFGAELFDTVGSLTAFVDAKRS